MFGTTMRLKLIKVESGVARFELLTRVAGTSAMDNLVLRSDEFDLKIGESLSLSLEPSVNV